MSKVAIAYFEGRARVEPIRVILEELGAPWRTNFADERADYVADELGPALDQLERFLESNANPGGLWVGSSLTFVDLIAYALLDSTDSMFPEALEKRPALREFRNQIASRPRIAAYVESGRRPATIQLGPRGPIYDSDF